MIYFISFIFGTIAIIFFARLHQPIGALILGFDAAGIDFCLQWLRFKLSARYPKYLVLLVFGGLAARALSLFLFLKLGIGWFGFNTFRFYYFAIGLLIMVPALSLFAAYKFKPQRD